MATSSDAYELNHELSSIKCIHFYTGGKSNRHIFIV